MQLRFGLAEIKHVVNMKDQVLYTAKEQELWAESRKLQTQHIPAHPFWYPSARKKNQYLGILTREDAKPLIKIGTFTKVFNEEGLRINASGDEKLKEYYLKAQKHLFYLRKALHQMALQKALQNQNKQTTSCASDNLATTP